MAPADDAIEGPRAAAGAARPRAVGGARGVGWFLARVLGWYFVVLVLWIPLGDAYRAAGIALGNAVFRGSDGHEVSFVRHEAWAGVGVSERADVAVLARERAWADTDGRRSWVLAKAVVTLAQPYAATAFLVALFFAGRLAWRERLWRSAAALVVLHTAMLACVWIDVRHALASVGEGGVPFALSFLHLTVTDWPAGVVIAPLLVWAACVGGRVPVAVGWRSERRGA